MTPELILSIMGLLTGSGGLWAYLKARQERPVHDATATHLGVESQAIVISNLTAENARLGTQLQLVRDELKEVHAKVERLVVEVELERKSRELAEHEREQQRMTIAKLESQLRSQSARIGALKRYLRKLGHDPDEIEAEAEAEAPEMEEPNGQ